MKLYIWADPYPVAYGSSMAIAVAGSVEEAKAILRDSARAYAYARYSEAVPKADLGEPTRVVDLPCGEWHRWSE